MQAVGRSARVLQSIPRNVCSRTRHGKGAYFAHWWCMEEIELDESTAGGGWLNRKY